MKRAGKRNSRKKALNRRDFLSVAGVVSAGVIAVGPKTAFSREGSSPVISIDFQKPEHKISTGIYGQFIEELGKCIEGGIWRPVKGADQFLGGVPWDLMDALKKIRPSMMRWPGGCYADWYHWKDGIGPREKRQPKPNTAWGRFGKKVGPDNSNQFGTDEFILFCRELKMEPMPTANVGTGTPEEAAAWVEYCNGPASSKWGAARAANGHREPYNIKYWFVGNEMWGELDGSFTVESYAKKYLEFSKAMRANDPGLILIASGFTDPLNTWNKKLTEMAGKDFDYLSIHSYHPPNIMVVDGEMKKKFAWNEVFKGLDVFEKNIKLGISAIEQNGPKDREVKVTFDEWNLWYQFTDVIQTNFNLRDGLFVAAMLGRLQRLADKVPIANLAQTVNCIGIIISDERGTFLTPSAWAFNLYTQYNLDRYLRPSLISQKSPGLEVSATRDEAGNQLSLFLVNYDREQKINAQLSISGFNPAPEAELALLWHQDPMKYNTFKDPNAIKPEIKKLRPEFKAQGNGTSFSLELPEHSISVVALKQK